jgi:hypothetical protein
MGTRADFYVRKEKQMEWVASKSFDGYPGGIDKDVLSANTEKDFRDKLQEFLAQQDDVTYPSDGWPWPWDDSRTTDYSYIFEKDKVMASNFGYPLFDPNVESDQDDDESKMDEYFPNMKDIKNVAFGKRSGMTIVQRTPEGGINII